MKRRDFLKQTGGAFLAGGTLIQFGFTPVPVPKTLRLSQPKLRIGLGTPFKALHFSDCHITLANARDNDRKRALAATRLKVFPDSQARLAELLTYAKSSNEMILHTGDLIDFVSEANLDAATATFRGRDCITCPGNHEFSQYVGEATEDDAYKQQSYAKVQAAWPNDLTFFSRVAHGVNFVALDNVYYNFTDSQLAKFKLEIAKGLPIVLLCHVPIYTPDLFTIAYAAANKTCAYLIGVPEERMYGYTASRRTQQRPNAATLAFIEYLKAQPLVKAVLCGHLHYSWSGQLSDSATQYVTGGAFNGEAQEITFT
jgi:UDP-2,3-diacylglucosamine pyrophosphatase LpxH